MSAFSLSLVRYSHLFSLKLDIIEALNSQIRKKTILRIIACNFNQKKME